MSHWTLNSLRIRNYRALENLTIDRVGRINLITGRNNVGKTSLLESLRLLASQSDINALLDIIDARDESLLPDNEPKDERDERQGEYSLLGSLCLFSGYPSIETDFEPIEILGNNLSLRILVKDGEDQQKLLPEFDEELSGFGSKIKVLVIECGPSGKSIEFPLPSYYSSFRRNHPFERRSVRLRSRIPCVSLASATLNSIDSYSTSALWDNVALTDKEEYVIRGLRVIEPRIDRVNFIRGSRRDRIPVIRLNGIERPVPLHGLGDGVTRIFEIMLALVNSENGFLLVDEFENGLHYSIQSTAWETVLELSELLNVQVFATTHSNDCVNAFQHVAGETKNEDSMILTRLISENGAVRSETLRREKLTRRLELGREVR